MVRVYVDDWLIADGEVVAKPGTLLRDIGLRLRGDLLAEPRTLNGLLADDRDGPHGEQFALWGYDVTGSVKGGVRDLWTASPVPRGRSVRSGIEFVIDTGDHAFQAQCDDPNARPHDGSRVTLSGSFSVVGAYEWGDFDLVDTRGDWTVEEVIFASPIDGAVLDLAPVAPK